MLSIGRWCMSAPCLQAMECPLFSMRLQIAELIVKWPGSKFLDFWKYT